LQHKNAKLLTVDSNIMLFLITIVSAYSILTTAEFVPLKIYSLSSLYCKI